MSRDDSPRPRFDRRFLDSEHVFSTVGKGRIGGKARGLARAKQVLEAHFGQAASSGIEVGVPRLVVLATDVFDVFMRRNALYELALSEARDDEIAHAFQKGHMPAEAAGDLRAIVNDVRTPLAVRSSSLLEDAMLEPFAGVYGTKMVPNNQLSPDSRFRVLVEAIKFVYASTFFENAKTYRQLMGHSVSDEKMAVIIQEVVGLRHEDRFYPTLSGVARSYHFYSTGPARPEEGVVSLALGLGKTVVEGEKTWTFSPAYPRAQPPFGSPGQMLQQTQTEFWAVNMGKSPAHDPIHETEYLSKARLADAERDGTLRFLTSTYDPQSDRISMGTRLKGPRVLNFAPLLGLNDIPLSELLQGLLSVCWDAYGNPVEIEFAMNLDPEKGLPARFGFLQVRPMCVSDAVVVLDESELEGERVLAASTSVLGNGVTNSIVDVVYVKPETFEMSATRTIAAELDAANRRLLAEKREYVLVVLGRLGSTDPWLGIPVEWVHVAGAKVIVEARIPRITVEPSQGSHFFQNVTSLQVLYFSAPRTGKHTVKWSWLDRQPAVFETDFVRHVRLPDSLLVKVDGRTRRGVIWIPEA